MPEVTPTIWLEHVAAWRRARALFRCPDRPPRARGLLVGEAPGVATDPAMPLFPHPPASAGGRLLRWSGADPADWLGKLVRVNMCDGRWSERRATAGRARALAFLLDRNNFHDGRPLRVLLIGARVARAWACHGQFGYVTEHYGHDPRQVDRPGETIHVAWIPHPSGRNTIYNDRRNQLRARDAVLWAMGDRRYP